MSDKPDWDSLSEVQLKGALVRRGLSSDGTKEEMVTRLKNNDEESPVMFRNRMLYGYYVTKSFRTVFITPFKKEVMASSVFVKALDAAVSYQIQKAKSGKSAVRLVFKDVNEGDQMFFQLRNKLSSLGVDVLHPANPSTRNEKADEIHEILRVTEQYGDRVLRRTVVLDKVPPALNTEDKLTELFPEAVDAISFHFDTSSVGIAILEFASEEEVDGFIKTTGNEMDLEGEKVTVTKFQQLKKQWNKSPATKKKSEGKVDPPSLSDEERVSLVDEIIALDNQLSDLQGDGSISGRDKVIKVCHLNEARKLKHHLLNIDTKRRVTAKQMEFPEGEAKLLKATEQVIKRMTSSTDPSEKDGSKTSPKKESSSKSKTGSKKSTAKTSTSPKKKTTKVVSMKGVSSSRGGRPNTAPVRMQGRQQLTNQQRKMQSAAMGRGLLPNQRQALVMGRGRSIPPLIPGGRGRFGFYDMQGPQNFPRQRGKQYEDRQAKIIVEGLTNVLSEKVRELEHMQHMQQQQQQFGGHHQGGHRYNQRGGGGNQGMMGYEGGHYPDQDRMLLEQFYSGERDLGGMGYGGDHMRGVYDERAPYSNFRGRGRGRGYNPHWTGSEIGGGYGRGTNW